MAIPISLATQCKPHGGWAENGGKKNTLYVTQFVGWASPTLRGVDNLRWWAMPTLQLLSVHRYFYRRYPSCPGDPHGVTRQRG